MIGFQIIRNDLGTCIVQKQFKYLSNQYKLSMQMPGVGFIGGKLSVIGGYSWPGGVDLLEEFDEASNVP